MKLIDQTEITEKKSRFLAYYYSITQIDDLKLIISTLKKEHKKATHFVYVLKIDNLWKKSNAKEPGNSATAPIINLIEKKQLNNILIIVVRYFGGIKLGIGGLSKAYKKVTLKVISH